MTTITKLHLNWNDYDIGSEQNVKVFTLSSTSDLVNAQAALNYYLSGGYPILELTTGSFYTFMMYTSTTMEFAQTRAYGSVSNSMWWQLVTVKFNISSGTVTSITSNNNNIQIKSSAPTSWSNSIITLVI